MNFILNSIIFMVKLEPYMGYTIVVAAESLDKHPMII